MYDFNNIWCEDWQCWCRKSIYIASREVSQIFDIYPTPLNKVPDKKVFQFVYMYLYLEAKKNKYPHLPIDIAFSLKKRGVRTQGRC